MLLWFADLMNVTEEVTIHRPKVSTLLSSAFIRGINGIETQLTIVVPTKPNILILFLLILFQLSHTFLVYKELIGIRLFEFENDDF